MAGRQFQLPLPSPSEAFFIPTGQPLFQGSLQAGFPLFGVIVHWQKRPLAAVVGHCSFFGRWMATAESYDEKWQAHGNVDRCAVWGLRLLPLSGLHRRLYSAHTPCPITPPLHTLEPGLPYSVDRQTALYQLAVA